MKKEARLVKKRNKDNRRRAVSPVVSTIILIMIVIILAIIIILFFRSFFKEAVIKTIGDNSKRVQDFCSEVTLKPVSNSDGTFGVSNEGNIPIYSVVIKTSSAGSSDTIPVGEFPVNPGYSRMITGYDRRNYESVKVIPVLLGKTKSDLVEPYTCPDNYGVDI